MRELPTGVLLLWVLERGRSPYKVIKVHPQVVTEARSADEARESGG